MWGVYLILWLVSLPLILCLLALIVITLFSFMLGDLIRLAM